MAEPREVDGILDWMREVYGRSPDWPSSVLRTEWHRVLARTPAADALALVRRVASEHPKYPPTPIAMEPLVGSAESGLGGPSACPDCRAVPGWREMSCRYVLPDGTEHVRILLAACECHLGEKRLQAERKDGKRTLGWRDQWSAWQAGRDRLAADGGRVIGAWRTHRDQPALPIEARHTTVELAARRRSGAVAHVAGLMLADPDPAAQERRRAVERDRQRDAAGDVRGEQGVMW